MAPGPGCQVILLFDTYSIFYRAHHALPPMNTANGEPTAALYGVSLLLLKLLREQKPSGAAFALDRGPSFRKQIFDGYKARRARMPDELRAQEPHLREMIEALGAPSFSAPGFEADDVLATLARELAPAEVMIVSGDRDLLQTIDVRTRVLFIGRRGQDHVIYDEAKVRERFGLSPSALPSFVALAGDASDELPGIPGVGNKTASKWIAAYGDVATLLARVEELEPARLRGAVRERAAQIEQNEKLARLRIDVPLSDGPRFGPIDASSIARLRAVFERLEFKSLLARVDAL
jgi:DNA polymerase I